MEASSAIEALSALAQGTRLTAFRLLLRQGGDGTPAGEIAAALGVPATTLSFHLSVLRRAGLVRARRAGRQLLYAADHGGTRDLLAYLSEDCCQSRPELCGYPNRRGAAGTRRERQP